VSWVLLSGRLVDVVWELSPVVWRPSHHSMMPTSVKETVLTVLCAALRERQLAPAARKHVGRLPQSALFLVLSFCGSASDADRLLTCSVRRCGRRDGPCCSCVRSSETRVSV
jgi:hypothetical protein